MIDFSLNTAIQYLDGFGVLVNQASDNIDFTHDHPVELGRVTFVARPVFLHGGGDVK